MTQEQKEQTKCPPGLLQAFEFNVQWKFHKVMEGEVNRLKQFQHLDYWFSHCLPKAAREKKAMKARFEIAKVLTMVTHHNPYRPLTEEEAEMKMPPPGELPLLPLVHWNSDHWNALDSKIAEISELLDVDPATNDYFGPKLESLRTVVIPPNEFLSSIRWQIEQPLRKTDPGEEDMYLSQELLDGFVGRVESELDTEDVEDLFHILDKLIKKNLNEKGTGAKLVCRNALNTELKKPPFDLTYVQHTITKFLLIWCKAAGFPEVDDESQEFRGLKRPGEPDPVVVNPSHRQRTGNNAPAQAAVATAPNTNPPTNNNNQVELQFHLPNGQRRRVQWSEEETEAIRQGVREFSVGKWAEIKRRYPMVLANRTTVQIKDRYRTICRQGKA